MKYTLLDIVQTVLNAMDSDEVNSIHDTVESQQVASVVRECYLDILSRSDLPEQFNLFELEPSADPTKPTLMYLPSNIVDLAWVKYDTSSELVPDSTNEWKTLKYLPLQEFMNKVMSYQTDDSRVGTMVIEGNVQVQYLNDKFPQYYTTYNDRTILFDSFLADDGSTLRKDKTLCYGEKDATFVLEDSFVPPLDAKQFRLLINETKALAFAEIKQTQHAKAEASARRGWINLQRTKHAIKKQSALSQLRGYGRK